MIAKTFLILHPCAGAQADEMLNVCREHLAAYKVPREVQFAPDLPKTSTGKIMRRELPKLDA